MFEVKNFLNNSNIGVLQEKGQFTVIEHYSDLSVSPGEAAVQFYMTQMKVRRRQLVCDLLKDPQAGVTLQAGAMQWMVGDVSCTTGIKGAGTSYLRPCVAKLPESQQSSQNIQVQVC